MGLSSFQLHLDPGSRQVMGGGRVSGKVELEGDSGSNIDELKVRLVARTHGKGNVWSHEVTEFSLGKPDLTPDRAYPFPFEFQVPNGPATSRGHYVNLDWYVEAELEIPWSLNPKRKVDFQLTPNPAQPYEAGDSLTRAGAEAKTAPTALGGQSGRGEFPWWVPLLILAASAGVIAWAFLTDADDDWGFMALLVFALTGFAGIGRAKRGAVEAVIGEVKVLIDPPVPAPGTRVTVHVHIDPKSEMELRQVTVDLLCVEEAVSGSGTNQSTHRHDAYKETVKLSGPVDGHPGQPLDFKGELEIPKDAQLSLEVGDNSVNWHLVPHVDVPRFPDWKRQDKIYVLPP